MQSVTNDFKSIAVADNRKISAKVSVAWDRSLDSNIGFFTIGTSLIGGTDQIKGDGDSVLESDQYVYTDESDYLMSLQVQRGFNLPAYSVARAVCDVVLNNNTDRFTPSGGSDIEDYILPARPFRAYFGFNIPNSITELIQLFIGVFDEIPTVNKKEQTVSLHGQDFAWVLWNFPLEQEQLFTDSTADVIIGALLEAAGLSADSYELDTGINTIAYAAFSRGEKIGDIIEKLCAAEQARFYIDENGIYRFENREHWATSPHTVSQLTISDDMVLDEKYPDIKNIINVVEIKGSPRALSSEKVIFELQNARAIPANGTLEFFADYSNPVQNVVTPTADSIDPSYWTANEQSDGGGADKTNDITLSTFTTFSSSSKIVFTNATGSDIYLTGLIISGKAAEIIEKVYVRVQDDDSVATYDERVLTIDNNYIQSQEYAQNLAGFIVADRKDPQNNLQLTIVGQPHLQLGDRVTRNGSDYFITNIKLQLTPDNGLVQELLMIKHTVHNYFTIGVSDIGGSSVIAP